MHKIKNILGSRVQQKFIILFNSFIRILINKKNNNKKKININMTGILHITPCITYLLTNITSIIKLIMNTQLQYEKYQFLFDDVISSFHIHR